MRLNISVQVTMPNNQVYKILIDESATVQDALKKLVAKIKIMKNKYVNEDLFLFFEIETYSSDSDLSQKLEQRSCYQWIEPEDFATTKIQDLIQRKQSILKLKFKVPDRSTKIYNHMNKNLIKLNNINIIQSQPWELFGSYKNCFKNYWLYLHAWNFYLGSIFV